jgi:hypothetical protein
MLSRSYVSRVTQSLSDEELSDEELFLDKRYSAVSRRIGRLPRPDATQSEDLMTAYKSSMSRKLDSMAFAHGVREEPVETIEQRGGPDKPVENVKRSKRPIKQTTDLSLAVKRGVRDYHSHCIALNTYYATPTVTPCADEGLTHEQRVEHQDAERCLGGA